MAIVLMKKFLIINVPYIRHAIMDVELFCYPLPEVKCLKALILVSDYIRRTLITLSLSRFLSITHMHTHACMHTHTERERE